MRFALPLIALFFSVFSIASAAVDQELIALVPSSSKVITNCDVTQAKNSPFGQYMLNRIDTNAHTFDELTRETGFDPRRDLQAVMFATSGKNLSHNPGGPGDSVVIVRGSFDKTRINALAKSKGAKAETVAGTKIWMGPDDPSPAFAFISSDIVVVGDLATIRQIVANRGFPSTLDPAVQQLISSVGPTNDIWFVSAVSGSYIADKVRREASKQPVPLQALDSISESSGGIQFGDSVRLSFDATARSPKDAQSLVDIVRFLGSLIQLNRQKAPALGGLSAAMDEMTLQAEGDAVHIALSIPEQTLEQLTELSGDNSTGFDVKAHHN